MIDQYRGKPPVHHTAGTTTKREFDKDTGHLISETVEESHWLEILFTFIGVVVVAIAIFVGMGRLEIGALGGTIGAVSSLAGVVIAGKKKSKGRTLRALDYGLMFVSLLALLGSLLAIYLAIVHW